MQIRFKGITLNNKLGVMLLVGLSLAVATPVTANASSHRAGIKNGSCRSYEMPVAMTDGAAASQTVHATYCKPSKWAHGKHQIDVLTPGSTYTSEYWMWPQNPSLYSYADKTLESGRAVLTYDRIGSGKSSRPVSTDVTVTVDSYILNQVVQKAHQMGYTEVNSIGHSYGSGIAVREAATYHDVSRVVLTGYLHTASNPAVLSGNYPANQDPMFASLGLDNGYLTSKPGVRGASLYSSSASANVIAYDEAHKNLTTATGLGSYIADKAAPAATSLAKDINVPVLSIAGAEDYIFCFNPSVLNCSDVTAMQAHEGAFYSGASSFTYKVVANTGHDIALHPSAKDSYKTINNWLKRH